MPLQHEPQPGWVGLRPLPAGPGPLCPGLALCSCCSRCPELWCPEQSRGPTNAQCQPGPPRGCGTVDAADPRHRRLRAWHGSSAATLGALGAVWSPPRPTAGPSSPIPRCALGFIPGLRHRCCHGVRNAQLCGRFSAYAMCPTAPGPTAAPVPGPVVQGGGGDPSALFLGSSQPVPAPPSPNGPGAAPQTALSPTAAARPPPSPPQQTLIQRN